MARRRWTGASSTNFGTAGNWLDETGTTGAPANGDVLIFDGLAQNSVEAGLSTALTGVTIIVEKSFPTDKYIGAVSGGEASPLILDGGTLEIRRSSSTNPPVGSQRLLFCLNLFKTVTSITRSGTTATVTSAAHGYSNGNTIAIHGADQDEYNINAVISNVATDTFDYTVSGTPTTPATTKTGFKCSTATASTVNIEDSNNTGHADETFYPPIQIYGSNIAAAMSGGFAGFAVRPSQFARLTSLRLSAGGVSTPALALGVGVSITDAVLSAGKVIDQRQFKCNQIRLNSSAIYEFVGAGKMGTAYIDSPSAEMIYSGAASVETLIDTRGKVDFSKDARAKTIQKIIARSGYNINYGSVPGNPTITDPVEYPDGQHKGTEITPAGVKRTLVAI